ncbi:MAG TPA: hypothetical protein VKE69_11295 [Planctomycetota bacterium]|nr:hypothetical protein [Planctomycetota bacterium]
MIGMRLAAAVAAGLALLAIVVRAGGFGPAAELISLAAASFALLAFASPEPANGPKLVVLPLAVALAAAGCLRAAAIAPDATTVASSAFAAVVANVALLASRRHRDKRIDWTAGGRPFLAVALLAFAVALGALGLGLAIEGVASFGLAIVFSYFVTTRVGDAIVGHAFGLALVAGLLACTYPLPGRDRDTTAVALALGALYASTHAARGVAAWTVIGLVLAAGTAAYSPTCGVALAAPAALAGLGAERARRWSGGLLLVLLGITVAAGVAVFLAGKVDETRALPVLIFLAVLAAFAVAGYGNVRWSPDANHVLAFALAMAAIGGFASAALLSAAIATALLVGAAGGARAVAARA